MRINWIAEKHINIDRVNDLLKVCQKTGQYTNGGENVKLLEDFTKNKLKIDNNKSVICVCNGTAAIHALVSGINLYHNKKLRWVTQSFTFPASAQGILDDAIIVDIDEEGGLDLNRVPDDCDGIIVTNIFGNVVDINKYEKWAADNNKILLFDNAATSYTFYKGTNSCNYGVGSIISFHHTKPIGFGEGGAIIVDRKYEESIKRICNFGIDNFKNLPWHKYASNYKISEIAAIYILQYMEDNFDKIVEHHKNLYKYFKNNNNIQMYPNFSDDEPFLSCFCLLDDKFDIELVEKFINNGIMSRKYYKPLLPLTLTTSFYNKIICLPCTNDVTYNNLDYYIKLIN